MSTQDIGKQCQGTNCTVVDGRGEHSRECLIEYAHTLAGEFPSRWKHIESGRIVTDVKEGHVRMWGTEWVAGVSYTVETGVQYTRDKETFLKKFSPVHEATCPTCGAGPDDGEAPKHAENCGASTLDDHEQMRFQALRRTFEAEAKALGFGVRRAGNIFTRHDDPEPWNQYAEESTGHRWAGYLAFAYRTNPADSTWLPSDSEESIAEFKLGQWWVEELNNAVEKSKPRDPRVIHEGIRAMSVLRNLLKLISELPQGNVVVTWDENRSRILAVTRQDDEGKILSVIAQAPKDEAEYLGQLLPDGLNIMGIVKEDEAANRGYHWMASVQPGGDSVAQTTICNIVTAVLRRLDIPSLREQSEAWFKVMNVLRGVHPEFMFDTSVVRSGIDTATGAIQDLASRAFSIPGSKGRDSERKPGERDMKATLWELRGEAGDKLDSAGYGGYCMALDHIHMHLFATQMDVREHEGMTVAPPPPGEPTLGELMRQQKDTPYIASSPFTHASIGKLVAPNLDYKVIGKIDGPQLRYLPPPARPTEVRDLAGLKATILPNHPKNVISFVDMQEGKVLGSIILSDPEYITTAAPPEGPTDRGFFPQEYRARTFTYVLDGTHREMTKVTCGDEIEMPLEEFRRLAEIADGAKLYARMEDGRGEYCLDDLVGNIRMSASKLAILFTKV